MCIYIINVIKIRTHAVVVCRVGVVCVSFSRAALGRTRAGANYYNALKRFGVYRPDVTRRGRVFGSFLTATVFDAGTPLL